MSAELDSGDGQMERGSIPLDIDNVHMLLQVEQEQIQKRTFTNWVNAQLAKRRPPCRVLDLFNDFRDGSKLLDLLEAMSGQHFSRERGRGMFQHRSNIEKALSFLQKKSIKLVNINIPDIIDGKPSIILGLIWTIILQYHIEELASCLSFDSRQSSMESLASLDTRSTLSSRSASSSPVPPKGSALHNRFRVSAKKALLLWVREQCHKAGCTINVKDFKASWRSGVVFLAILHALRPDVVDLSKAKTRSNKQNLKEAFLIAEKELRIPKLLEPDDVDVRDPDEKSIMTYVAQFLQYSRDMPVAEEEMQTHYLTPPKSSSPINLPLHYTPAISASPLRQATADQKAKEVTHWLVQAYEELLEGWDSTEGESYSERYHVFQTFLVSFNEQRRPIMPLLTAMRRTSKLSEEQRALREAWDSLSEKLREYKTELDMSLPPLLDTVARWLLKTEGVLAEEQGDPQDHGCAADEAREKQELLKVCLEEMPQQMRTFQSFQNMDEYGNLMVPTDKMDELKRRFTSVRVTAKYHGIKLEYWEHRHTVLDLLGQIRSKLHVWKGPYISPEAVRLLLQEWNDLVNTQGLPSLLEAALRKLKQISEKYSSKSALAADYHQVSKQVKQLEEETARALEELTRAKGIMGHVMSAWETYRDCLSSLQAWLEQGSVTHSHGIRPLVPSESMAEWGTRHAQLNEVGHLLIESTAPATSRSVTEELRKLNMHWAEFVKKNMSESQELSADIQANAPDLQALIREATLILKEPLETMAGPLRTYRKRLQFIIGKIKQVDIDALVPSPDCSSDQLRKLRLATPEVMQTLFEAEQVCAELQHSVSGLDSRLAELLHWEMEARELYQQLRSTDRKQKQSSQDPRARVIISRGLQLEGQVVTEEQDLQVIVITKQKSSPLQYLLASSMQERIQAAVAQSQEAIGMLSSMGSRRDKSRSPTEAGPPSKVLRESNTEQPSQRPVTVLPETPLETPDICIKPPALAQAPVQAYTEAYYKAQALARNGFEEAKHCLQAHIMEAITVFKDKRFSAEQASVKENTLRALDPELLDEFLRAAKGMEAFCTPAQLGDMEFFTQSVRTQWEACFSRDFSEAGQHLEALKELCDTLSPEDAHRLAQTQLMECEKRLAAIQRQFSGDKDTSHPDSRIQLAFSEDPTTQKEPKKANDKPQPIAEVSQVTMPTTAEERREVEKQTSVEEVSKKDIFERYENCKRTLQTQMAKNEHSFKDVPSDSVSLKGLHTRLQEIQFLRQETESLWSEYTNQCSQCTQMSGDVSVEQEKIELQEQWRSQQANLQRRGSSLSAALRQIDSTENHMVDFVDRLDRYLRQPKDITGFTLANTNILKDIKELDDNIQNELDQLFRLNPESSDLDPRECFPLTREVETHKASLDQLRQQVRKSEAAARALDRFLMSLRTVDEDISGVQGAPCSDSVLLQDCRSKLALIRQSIDSLKEKAPQLDLLLQGARLTVTRDGIPASCLDMVNALLRRLEEADTGLASQQRGLQKETQSKSLGLRKRALLGELKRLLETIEKQSLKESTMPAVQHKLRALSDLESQLQAQHSELHSLRELQEKEGGGEDLLQELEAQWNETQTSFFERKKQCNVLLELLKKYQTCRSHLSNTIQKAEQTITDQASYMGKDNLQRSMTKVSVIKEELGCLGEQMEEMRGVCKQLQSELKKFPECSQTLFEAEAHILMDNWLDVTEKTDAFMDNLRVGLELWEKQLMLGGEVDSWAGAKLSLFAESHPFHNEKQVLAMRDEIHANEENITHFHKKSVEIQEMLQSQEAPLELQVMETNLRKRMEQVKELFTDCTDVFEELIAVRKHLSDKIEECQTAVEHIQSCLSKLNASDTKVEAHIQDLCEDLESQEKQAEAVLKEVGLVSSVASPRVLEELSVDCTKLKEAISRTKDMIHLKREEGEKGLLKVINDERQSFEEWFQDLQLSVNECFENPESRTDVEISVQRLHGFLKSHDTKRRLDQLKDQIDRGSKQFPPQQLSELNNWLKEQKEEVDTFKTHCHNRQKQMDSLLDDLNCLQKQHDSFREWLQNKEKQSLVPENVKFLLQDLHHESDRAETLSELLASIRRQGVRADNLLKDGDNLIQRYRNLEARLQKQADAQKAVQEEFQKLKNQAESTVAWISDLLQPITFPGRKTEMEIKSTALAVLNSKSKGESEIHYLRRQLETLCKQESLEGSKKQEAQLFVRDAEEQWRSALQAAEEAVHKAETQIILNKANDAFQTENESFQSWIKDQNDSLGANMQTEEKKRILQTILSSRPDGESKLQDLKQKFQILCNSEGLNDDRRQEIRDAVKHAEEQWSKVLHSAEEGLIHVEKEAASERDFDAFKNQNETIRSWIRQQRQRVLDLSSLMQFEERLQISQAVMASESEGDSKLLDLNRQSESLCERIEESRKLEIEQLLNNTEQQWRTVLQSARQAELRCLSDDFESQSKHAESWIRDKQQKLNSVGSHKTPEQRCRTAQTLLTSRPEGDYQVNNLRRRGQSLCDHQDADEGRNAQVQQAVKDIEEQWRAVLQAAKQVEAAAEAEISQESERKMLELREFNTHQQGVTHWLEVIQQQLESLSSLTNAEDRLRAAEAVMSLKPEGDLKLQELRRQAQSLCDQDFEERKKREVQQQTKDTEERWLRILQAARQAVSQTERQCVLDGQVKDFQVLRGIVWAWLEEKKQNLISLDNQTNQEEAINTAQKILSSKPEGDSKLTELRRQSQSLADQEDLEEHTKREAQQAVQDSEEEWKIILQTAENNLKKAEIQYSLSKELESFWTQENNTKTWVEDMQTKADSMGEGTQGTKAQIEEQLNTARVILSSKSNVATQVTELKRRAQSICDHRDLEKNKRDELQQIVRNTEAKWTTIVHIAEERQRELQGVVERLVSSQHKRDQAEACLAELQKQTDNLPCVFPWPGLGERRQAVEQARILLDKSVALAPVLSDVRAQATELFEITQDQSWQVPAWATEENIPALLKKLTDAVENLEQGILTERHCTLLIEQHQAAQDWLREQVKGLGPPPVDKNGLHSAANNLKALLQTVDREQREMKELDSSKDSLLRLCTPGGQDALNLEVSHLHNLCANSEREVKEHLTTCERRLEEMDCELAKMAQELKERAAALQWELRSLDQALSYSEPQDNIDQLKQHWNSLQNCEMSLQYLGVKVHDLYQEIMLLSSNNELPPETIRVVESLCQQHASLKSRLGEHQSSCSSNTARCLQDCLDALGKWNNSTPSDSISSVQGTLEEGEKLMNTLQEVLSHQQFLTACLEPECFERLQKEKSEILRELDLHKANLRQHLKELEQRSKEPVIQPPNEQEVLSDKISTESLQTIEKLSTDTVLVEETQLERPSSTESKATASVLMMENVVVEPLQKSAMNNIFSEIQKLARTGTISQLIEGKPLEDAPETLMTSTSDLDMRLSRLVSKVLSLKNCPAELSLTSMTRQLEEAQECRLLAQLQVSLFSELKEADTINRETLENMEDQWNAAAQDGAAVIHSKEAQLDLVTDYWTQTQTVNATVDKLSAELDAVQRSPQGNSQQEVEQLCYLQRSMEENRTVLGELLVTHTKLYLHLSQSDQEAAQMGLKTLQERWGALERRIESNLHHTKVHSEHSNSLLSELSSLQECIQKIQKDLETMSSSVGQWNCKDAQQLMQSNAEIKAAQQQCQHLQKLSEEFLLNSRWEIESKEIDHRLQDIKDKLSHSEELMSSKSKNSSNPIMEKIIIVMRDGLAWARETESDIEGRRKRVPLLPEEVHRQLRGLKKLQADVMAKQGQLESLVEEVTELFPQMDQVEEVPIVHSSLECLEELSKSTTEKLSKAMKEVETGLQTREKLFEQIADLDSWILTHLQSMAAGSSDSEPLSQVELGSKVHRIQQTQAEAERQAAICEAIYMTSKDIASDLSVTETCLHFDKIRNLQEDIRTINRKEKANKEELEELIKTIDSRKKNAVTVENSLRLILADLSKHRYPITRESLQALEPFKLLILEHKSQIDLLVPWIPREKSNELNSVISELQNKMISLEMKSKDHERYLNMRQCVEDLKEHIQEQVHQTKEESRDHKERYRLCHTLLNQFPLMRELCKETRSVLQIISSDLYPSQLTVEQQRLKQNEESLETWEMALCNNLRLVEWDVLKELDIESEKKAVEFFLLTTQKELQRPSLLEPDLTLIDKEYQGVLSLKKIVQSRTKVLEVLEQKKGNKDNQESQDLMTLKNTVLSQCDSQMENICHARGCLREYTYAVNEALRFLRDIEACILPPQGSAGPCCESLKETQQTLLTLEDLFQTHVERLQNHFVQQTCLSPQKLEQLQQNILSQLLVKKSTLQAKCHVRLECLNRCAEQHSTFSKSYDEIIQRLTNVEIRLLEVISQKVSCLAECTVQKEKFTMLSEEMESLLKNLEGLKEWCPEQSCRGCREVTVTTLWRRVSRLHHYTQELVARSKQKVTEWLDITNSVEKASMELEQVEAELPDGSKLKASTEELQDLLHSWEQYQDALDCEHRALCALELRTAKLLTVPVPVEQAHSTILCQQLQEMQGRYDSVRQRGSEGVLAVKLELEERDKLREELQVVRVWVEAADSLLSDMEECSSTEELQDIYSQLFVQKALLQQIMENIKMKYSDMSCLAPVEIQSQLQEVSKSMEHVEAKVGEAMEKSGPVHQLGAKLSEIQAGLRSVQKRLEERSPSVIEAKFTQKRAWDELDMWHSRLASLEVDMQDLEKPEEALGLTERLVEVQELHSSLAKQAEQRTTLLSKIHTWLQEHKEMINSSKSWMAEAESWLSAPCTYTTAKCLSSHVNALQLVLDDAAQIRATLQGFSSVLKEMSQVCDVTTLQEQLNEAERKVADVQDSFSAPLSQLEHAAAEVEAIESEVKRMENDVAEIKALLSSPETFPKPKEDSLQEIELRIQSMSTTIAEIQKCKPGLCLPEKAEETLTVFNVVGQLQTLLLELEKKVPALFIQQPPTPDPTKMSAKLQKPTSEEAEEEQGQIRVVHLEEDVLKRSGGTLQTVEQSSPEQRQSRTLNYSQQKQHQGVLQAGETPETKTNEGPKVEDFGGSVMWWLWDAFLGASPEVPAIVVSENDDTASGQSTEQTEEDKKGVLQDVEGAEASSSEVLSKPVGTVRTQSLPESMGSQPEPSSHEPVLHECLGRVCELELWLLKAQRSLFSAGDPGSAAMQGNVEQQLLTCQEMFLEIEEKVARLSALSSVADQQQLSELGAVGSQQAAAEQLASKLEHVKASLMSFQQLLQDKNGEEEPISSRDTPEQKTFTLPEHHPKSKLKRSSSVQEIFTSPRNKLLRQSSLQQQKELELELAEQRGLTLAIARQGSRVQLYSPESDDQSQPLPRSLSAEADVEEAQKKWDRLHSQLLALEESCLLPPSEVTDSSMKGWDGTAGHIIGTKNLKELQTYISYLRELGHTSAKLLNQASPIEDAHHTLDEGLFNVLHGAFLSLSSINSQLLPTSEGNHEENTQLRLLHMESLSAELVTLGSELVSQGSKVSRLLGSDVVQQCVDDLSRVLSVVRATLSKSEKQLRELQEDTAEKRAGVQMQESLQQQAEQANYLLDNADQSNLSASLIDKASQLQGELDTLLGGVRCHCEELKSKVCLEQLFQQLVHGLEELLSLGSERITRQPDMELHSRAQLQQQLHSHTKFFKLLGYRIHVLQYLNTRVPDTTLKRRGDVLMGLQDKVDWLQQRGLEKGIRMQETLQMWSQWEEDSFWADSQLKTIEATFPCIQWTNDHEEQVSQNIAVYQELHSVLKDIKVRFSLMLELGQKLSRVGCGGVSVSTLALETRWNSLHRRLEQEHSSFDKMRKLRSRFLLDSPALASWMAGARESANKLSQATVSFIEPVNVQQRRDLFLQSVDLTKDLKAKTQLRLVLMHTLTELVELGEAEADPFKTRLEQLESEWSSLVADITAIQHSLHKFWMEGLTQQAALLELQAFLTEAESQLKEHHTSISQNLCTDSVLTTVHNYCKECQIETSAHQATVDYINQPLKSYTTGNSRHENNQYAEEQGRLNYQWQYFEKNLETQIQGMKQELRDRRELDALLQQINSWITDQNLWIDSVQAPSSQTELHKSLSICQDLEEKIEQKHAALRELRDKICSKKDISSCDYTSNTEKSIQACAALTQQNESLKRRLIHAQNLWNTVDEKQKYMMLKTIRISQTVECYCSPQLSLQAQMRLHEKLKLLLEETQSSEAEWDELSQITLSLSGIISPGAVVILAQWLDRQRECWNEVAGALSGQLLMSQRILVVWEVYAQVTESLSKQLQTLQGEVSSVLNAISVQDNTVDMVTVNIHNVQSLLDRSNTVQSDLEWLLKASKDLIGHLEPAAVGLVQSETRLLSRGFLQLSQQLSGRLGQLQEELKQRQEFENALESLEGNLVVWQQRLENVAQTDKSGLLELSSLSADLDVLNELSCSLTLGDAAARRLQRLNRCWSNASVAAEEACSEHQVEALRQQTFEQKCESWMSFLQRMEDGLAVDVSGSYLGLRQQFCTHKRFQAELSTGHQILHSVITEALHLLQKGEVEDRSDFILKLAQLREHWQGALQRTDQRRSLVEGLLKHWHLYGHSLRKLQRFLSETQTLLPPVGPARYSLQQLRRSFQDLQHTELLFQRYQSTFIHTLEVGRHLFSMGNEETQTQLQMDLGTLQEEWDSLHSLLGRRMDLTEAIIKNWERCEAGIADSMLQLKDMKTRLNQSMPECDADLQSAEKFYKENEDSLEDWAESLTELSTMKTDLSQYIIADDVLLLQEQVEDLHCQWEELCVKVSLRKQEIADRLNAWIIFNEKNKELCEWLTQMENKVAHNSDLNIEEMVEKLKKDCMEEINLFSENKTHLKQLGEQLITASNKTKETEINEKLKDVNDRWQHLFDHIEARVRKLKETLVTVQQLDKNMSNLRTWLSRIEAELAKPVVYDVCHSDEIQRKLSEQQDLQRDIEQHTESVASVLTLCDVLLHDADACGSDLENDSIQQTTRSLDRRWRNICAMSMERRMRIEETWRLWCKFLDDYSRFEDWLRAAELTAASPDSANVLYTSAKEELKKFEAFQRQVHERLTQLELVNKQYRRLARENRTDAASKIKVMVHDGNQRWDFLQRRVAAVLRRLKHFTSQREDFEGTREGILVWLTEMDLQLTNVEHFSESDIEDKMRQMNGFQQEITLNTNKIDALIVFGENLIQKSSPLDAVLIEDELEELHSYCQEVFGRVARFHHRLVNRRPVLDEEREMSDRDTDMDDTPDLNNRISWTEVKRKKEENEAPAAGGVSPGRPAMCQLLVPPPERSGRETPVSVDSIPLEWDHTVDVGGSSSHEDDEDATFFSSLSDVNVTENSDSFVKSTVRAMKAASVKSVTDPPSWHQPISPERKQVPREIIQNLSSSPTRIDCSPFHRQGYAKLMSECSGSINSVKRVKLLLNDDEELESAGLTSSTANKQTSTGVIERWELLQVQRFTNDSDIKQDLEQWQKLNSDLCDVTSWLGRVLPELERLQRIAPSTSIKDIEFNIKRLKEIQRTFNSYKCLMISVNLSGRHFLRGDSVELQELQEALTSTNQSWTQACSGLESWESKLHSALMQCQEFHEMLHTLLMWLSKAEGKLCAVNIEDQSVSPTSLLEHRDTLMALQEELRSRHQQVSALQDISSQLLLEASGEESVEAKEKVHVIGNKLHLLVRQAAAALTSVQGRMEAQSQAATVGLPGTKREERKDPSPQRPFLYRVLRAAFPLHLLVLMLLVLVCLVPLSDEDHSCTLSNNFARSFYPMLHYTNGPPPT
ncbi:unnamed protein product [Menidia menidia]|uniref:(Atlantic silverside) hypothetical protein n=1 Tax=Menidia menidia TaxID=238744 RepID=A0A8S4ARQ3_9TELE|nr:unnamed protein product [Menidia menidia]